LAIGNWPIVGGVAQQGLWPRGPSSGVWGKASYDLEDGTVLAEEEEMGRRPKKKKGSL